MEGLTLRDTNVNTYPKTLMIKTVQNRQRDRHTDNDTVWGAQKQTMHCTDYRWESDMG